MLYRYERQKMGFQNLVCHNKGSLSKDLLRARRTK